MLQRVALLAGATTFTKQALKIFASRCAFGHTPECRVQLSKLAVNIDVPVESRGCFEMLHGLRGTTRADQRRRGCDAVLGSLRLSLDDLPPRVRGLVMAAGVRRLHGTLAQQVDLERAALFLV